MTLQSSSTTHSTNSNPGDPVMAVSDAPLNNKQQWTSKGNHSSLCDGLNTPLSPAESAAMTSPSVSAVVDALHLSDIDWDALSFTSSPTPLLGAKHGTKPKLNKIQDTELKETENIEKTFSDVREADPRSATELCYAECSLRDRVLMRNTAKALNPMEVHNDVVSIQLKYDSASLIHTSSHNSNSKPNGQIPSKVGNDNEFPRKESLINIKEPPTDKRQHATNKAKSDTQSSKQRLDSAEQAPSRTRNKYNGCEKPPQKYTFVRTAISSSIVPPQRNHSDPSESEKNVPQTTKKSVCMSVTSSSEESDTENQQFGPQRESTIKPRNKIKDKFPLKPLSGPKTAKIMSKTAHTVQLLPLKSQICSVGIERNGMPVSTESIRQEVPTAHVNEDGNEVFLQDPASPAAVLDSDDSVICSESPLPLAERLRLKFLT